MIAISHVVSKGTDKKTMRKMTAFPPDEPCSTNDLLSQDTDPSTMTMTAIPPTNTSAPTASSTSPPTATDVPTLVPTSTMEPTATELPTVAPTQQPTVVPTTVSPTPTLPPTLPPAVATAVPTAAPISAVCDCSGNTLNCKDFGPQREAQACHDYCVEITGRDIHKLDGHNNDGIACENNSP